MWKSKHKIGDIVKYVPHHAFGDAHHPDCQNGIVTSISQTGIVRVLFSNNTASQGCRSDQLILVEAGDADI
jgi:hypothetical protein